MSLVERYEKASNHLAICSASRIGAMISFSDSENAEARAIIRDLLEAGSMPSMYSAQMVEAEDRARAFLGDT